MCHLETQTPVSLCGEMASDPLMTPLLLGLGIRKLSCSSRYIPVVRKMVNSLDLKEAEALAQEVLNLETSEEIGNLCKTR